MKHQYAKPPKIENPNRQWPDKEITESPIWCAVDLRDGNQALPNPMTPEQKKEYFKMLVEIGFKEIEIGFPSASADDFQFCRDLIEDNMIPDDVVISVLVQSREHLIRRTIEALKGVKKACVHVYIASSELHMKFVFGKTSKQTRDTAVEAVKLIRELADKELADSDISLEFSPEEFTDTDLDFGVEICDAVVEAWEPRGDEKVILNLPATVERRLPHEYADMIEQFITRQKYNDKSIISIHAHNDQGCAVASSEMAIMAGAQRVEGTLFGHGERSGNVDLVTMALNMQYLGVDTGLDFSNIEDKRDDIIRLTSLPISPRHPYAGELVFCAFSGSHQDAINKGLSHKDNLKDNFDGWKIPYLHIDPKDIGRSYEDFIRINSQSGKGGIAHVLQHEHNINLPRKMLINFSKVVQKYADEKAREVESKEVYELFLETYKKAQDGKLKLINYWPRPTSVDPAVIEAEVDVNFDGEDVKLYSSSDGPVSAFAKALRKLDIPEFTLEEFEEDAIGSGTEAMAVSYITLKNSDGKEFFGAGFHKNIDQAAVRSVTAALNNLIANS